VVDLLDRLQHVLQDRYLLERELGAGGMATVYLARDVRHDRPVALKVLRPELSAMIGAERFLTEIRTTANLQHPHILPLFDSGRTGGQADGRVDDFLYYVMPYVEGESLRDRLRRETQLPVADAVRIAAEVASALEYAHRRGVVHRDIKPENILLHDGRALVADFGIALAVTSAGSGSRMTETGMSLGTPHYMSPEQAMGEREITGRSDIYALGAVLYEMLVGEPPFTGPSAQAIVAKVLTEEPRPLLPKRHTIPPHVEQVVLTALEKLPADRYSTAGELLAALSDRDATRPVHHHAGTPAPPVVWWRRRSLRILVPAALAAAVLLVLGTAWLVRRSMPAPMVRRYGLALPASQAATPNATLAISSDGSRILFAGPGPAPGTQQYWLKEHDRSVAVPVAGTTGARGAVFSPDGEWIAFVDAGRVKKLPLGGGAAVTLADSSAPGFPLLAWLDDGSIIFTGFSGQALHRVSQGGGPETVVLEDDSTNVILPTALPGARFLYTRCIGGACGVRQDLWMHDLESGVSRELVRGAASGFYTSTGHLVYTRRDGTMLAVPFDLGSGEIEGEPVTILDSIATGNGILPRVAVSRNGTLVMRTGTPAGAQRYEMVWVDRSGDQRQIDPEWTFQHVAFGANAGWALSPDGSRLAIGLSTGAGDDIWVKQLPRGPLSRVSFDSAPDFRPRWLPDGRTVQFISIRGGADRLATSGVFRRASDGTGSDVEVLRLDRSLFEAVVSPDAAWLVVRLGGVVNQIGGRDIVAVGSGGDTTTTPLVASREFDESAIALSPDGRWLAYESNETGRVEVYVRPFPAADGGKWQLSTRGGAAPLWAPSGRELFYVDGDRRMVSLPVRAGARSAAFEYGEAVPLFRLNDALYLVPDENYTPYDISRDGERFLMARLVRAEAADAPLLVVDNWFEELKATVRRGGGR
jgi:serine/threonine-protein kinase